MGCIGGVLTVRYDDKTAYWIHECDQHKRRMTFTRRQNAEDCEHGHRHFGHSLRVNQNPSEWLQMHWRLSRAAKRR